MAYAKVNTCLNIRTGAGTEYGVSGTASQGRLLQGTGRCGRLRRIISDGIEGYVFKDYLITGVTQKEYLALTRRSLCMHGFHVKLQTRSAGRGSGTKKLPQKSAEKVKMVAAYALQFVEIPMYEGGQVLQTERTVPGLSRAYIRILGFLSSPVAADQAQGRDKDCGRGGPAGRFDFLCRWRQYLSCGFVHWKRPGGACQQRTTGIKVSNVYWENAVWAVRVLSGS